MENYVAYSGTIYLKSLKTQFAFYYNSGVISLLRFKKMDKKLTLSCEKEKIEFIKAISPYEGDVYFFDFVYEPKDLLGFLGYARSSMAVFPQSTNNQYEKIDAITFKGEIINKFFSPYKSVEEQGVSNFLDSEGKITSK